MKSTAYYLHTRLRADRYAIREEWIMAVIAHPLHTEIQADARVRKWGWIEGEGRFLRVILLADGETVHNVFFDRSFKLPRP